MYNIIVVDFFYESQAIIANALMAEIMQYVIENKRMNLEDFNKTETKVLEILKDLNDPFINSKLMNIKNTPIHKVVDNSNDSNISLKLKPRIVDPSIYIKNTKVKGSSLSKEIVNEKKRALDRSTHGIHIKLF